MSTIGDFFSELVAFIAEGFRLFISWWRWIYTVLIGFIYAIIKFSCWGIQKLLDLIVQVPALVSDVQTAVDGGSVSGFSLFIVTMNTFFPLDLLMAFFSILFQLWIFGLVYRFIKSLVPGLS